MTRTIFTPHKEVFSPSPYGLANKYIEHILDDGTMGLELCGQTDLNEFVQASRKASEVYSILDTFERTQDTSILDVVRGFCADVVGLPTSLMEAQNLKLSIDKQFSNLSSDLRSVFHNNSMEFADAVLSGNIDQILESAATSIQTAVVEKIVENVQKEGENK